MGLHRAVRSNGRKVRARYTLPGGRRATVYEPSAANTSPKSDPNAVEPTRRMLPARVKPAADKISGRQRYINDAVDRMSR